jgi:hypothetical protein
MCRQVIATHILIAIWVAKEDPAFEKMMREHSSSIGGFGLLGAIALISLLLVPAKTYAP